MSRKKNNNIYKSVSDKNDSGYNDIPNYSGYNPDCPMCNTTMGYSYIKSEFKCLSCGYVMHEDDWEYKFDYDNPNEPPYGCAICDGPWPHCKTSCKIFDN